MTNPRQTWTETNHVQRFTLQKSYSHSSNEPGAVLLRAAI